MKTCIVAIGRYEGEYIEEWVNYHLNLGFDHIYLADNNYDNPERFELILQDYIKKNKVTVFDCRGEYYHFAGQPKFYKQIYYDGILNDYDWILFIDIDEFITLTDKFKNIKEYLDRDIFNDFDVIKINWMAMTDGGHVINTGKPVLERFQIPAAKYCWETGNKFGRELKNQTIKSFVRPKLKNAMFDPHTAYSEDAVAGKGNHFRYCYNDGTLIPQSNDPNTYPSYGIYTERINYNDVYIKHFQTKTVEEYVKYKMKRGWNCYNENDDRYKQTLSDILNKELFFSINGYSPITDRLFDDFVKKYNIQYNGDFTHNA